MVQIELKLKDLKPHYKNFHQNLLQSSAAQSGDRATKKEMQDLAELRRIVKKEELVEFL